ncbi:stage II sporulation protein P [Paenibacillus koleovorans]|uniref:stage II sporulation protein P n=1 Tax=Paenibacillus koleovorans TaxID=121608 RepID=UPI000FDA9B92|nr:stage II sporulation protein P [Paenibacillus koleovorans]
MKWVAATINLSRVNRTIRRVRSVSRLASLLAVCTLACFILTGLFSIAQNKGNASSISSMKGMAANLSLTFFLDMVAMEMPFMNRSGGDHAISPGSTANFLIRYATNINMRDPKSLMAAELPGLAGESSAVLYSGSATRYTDAPADYMPAPQAIAPLPSVTPPNSNANGSGTSNGSNGASPPPFTETQTKQPRVLIYHSHNRESFLPELKSKGIKDPDAAYDAELNITLVGKKLKDKLAGLGIPTMQTDTDYPTIEKGFNYAKSYAYSAKTVQEAMAANQFDMIFDIHRDALNRDRTTAKLNGQDYAQVYFIVGTKNPDWKQNAEFAAKLHALLEERYPGISRGVYAKSSSGNGEYNQHFSPTSMLIEVGGPYNSLEEMYRTSDLLADIIAELIRQGDQAVKANTTPATPKP